MAITCFADVPDDRPERIDAPVYFDLPPAGVAVHRSVYRDDDCCVSFVFLAPIKFASYRLPLSEFAFICDN